MQVEHNQVQTSVQDTFVFVTHDQEEAMTMSDRIAVMNKGKVEQLGTPETLYEKPTTKFVAGFLGVSNLLDGTVTSVDGSVAEVELGRGERIRIPSEGVTAGSGITVGVRPEKLRISSAGESASSTDGRNSLEGSVTDAAYIGVSTQYAVRLDDGFDLAVYNQNIDTSGIGEQISAGERVRVTWQPQHTFVIKGQAVSPEAEGGTQVA